MKLLLTITLSTLLSLNAFAASVVILKEGTEAVTKNLDNVSRFLKGTSDEGAKALAGEIVERLGKGAKKQAVREAFNKQLVRNAEEIEKLKQADGEAAHEYLLGLWDLALRDIQSAGGDYADFTPRCIVNANGKSIVKRITANLGLTIKEAFQNVTKADIDKQNKGLKFVLRTKDGKDVTKKIKIKASDDPAFDDIRGIVDACTSNEAAERACKPLLDALVNLKTNAGQTPNISVEDLTALRVAYDSSGKDDQVLKAFIKATEDAHSEGKTISRKLSEMAGDDADAQRAFKQFCDANCYGIKCS